MIVDGYHRSDCRFPLVVVGSAPYSAACTRSIEAVAASDPRIRMLGGVWDQVLLDQLYSNALSYVHGHSVGGTSPSLLRAMGGGTSVFAYDVDFNREVVGNDGGYFGSPDALRLLLDDAECSAPGTSGSDEACSGGPNFFTTGMRSQPATRNSQSAWPPATASARRITALAIAPPSNHPFEAPSPDPRIDLSTS